MEKQELKEREAKIIELSVAFCNEHLDEECAELCTKLVQKLGRKRSNPLQSGRLEIWAAATVYTICSINFIFSKDSRLSMPSSMIVDYFGTSNSTVAQKSRTIKDLLKISQCFDTNFSLREIAENNPFNRLRMINGFYMTRLAEAYVPILASGVFKDTADILQHLGDSKYISAEHIDHLREDAEKQGLDVERVCRETDASRTMEGIYIKVEENGEVVDRMKYVRASFLQTVEESQSHWLDRPIIPNRITKPINELFV